MNIPSLRTASVRKLSRGSLLLALGLLHSTTAADARADTVYVTDSQNALILAYSTNGTPMGGFGSGDNNSFSPQGIAADGSGNIYVVNNEYGNAQILKYSPAGVSLGIFATNGLSIPQGVAVDGAGNVYVADFSAGLLKFSPDGSKFTKVLPSQYYFALAVDSSSDIYVANPAFNSINLVSPTGQQLPAPGSGSTGSGGLNMPEGLALDDAGNLYVANYGNATVERFSADGSQRSVFATNSLDGPEGIAFDGSGNLYVVNNGNFNIGGKHPLAGTIQKFGPDGSWLGQFADTMGAPHCIYIQKATGVSNAGPGLSATVSWSGSHPNSITISLDSSSTGFTLQSSADLSTGEAGWSSVVSITGATNVSVPASGSAQFFRLKK